MPPLAWDDDTIDDPAARPDLGAPSSTRGVIDPDEFEWVRAGGVSLELFARNHGVQPKSVETALERRTSRLQAAAS